MVNSFFCIFAACMEIKNELTKKERISSKTEIDLLFTKGSSFVVYPLRLVYFENIREEGEDRPAVSIMASVSKKKFKRAVKRNRLKRLIKESYRLNKSLLIDKIDQSKFVSLGFVYLSHEEKSYSEIESAMQQALKMLSVRITGIEL